MASSIIMNDKRKAISGETYFFRDHGQFELLRLRLLPELIDARRHGKTLRLWSAGCASGEEAYSLAILIDMLLPARGGWDISIIGSDIDRNALAKAKSGRYGPWSFRMVPPEWQQRYFRRQGNEWLLDQRIRRMVTFLVTDLIAQPLPSGELRDMDLILCRNVLIYFDAEEVASTAGKLAATLAEGGYLMTAHAELTGRNLSNVQRQMFPESVVYRRMTVEITETVRPAVAVPVLPAIKPALPEVLPAYAPALEALLTTARTLADRGAYARAEQTCQQALSLNPLTAQAYFLLAQLAQLKGDYGQATALLNKTLYLDPDCVAALLELAALSNRTDNPARAQSLRDAALNRLRALPSDVTVEPYGIGVAQLVLLLST